MISISQTLEFLHNPNINWKNVILGITAGKFAFDNYLEYRQYQFLKRSVPPVNVKDVISQETFEKSQKYSRAQARQRWAEGVWGFINEVIVVGTDFIPFFWSFSGTVLSKLPWFSNNVIAQSVMFLILKTNLDSLLKLPLDYYDQFVLEEKYGFNKMSLSLWIKDWLKERAVFTVFAAPVIAVFLKILSIAGGNITTYIQVFWFVLQLFLMTVIPKVIMPLFNKFTPLEESELRTAIEELATREKFPLTKLLVVDGSKRSSHSNAFFTGLPWSQQIVLFDTLIEQQSQDEIVSVLAHEIGHWKLSHLPKLILFNQATMMITIASISVFSKTKSLFASYGFSHPTPDFICLFLISYVMAPWEIVRDFISNQLSRTFEYEADEYAKNRGYAQALGSALIKLKTDNLSTIDADPWYSRYKYNHPILTERLSALGYVSEKKAT